MGVYDSVRFYVVGGYVRDKILGIPSKDVDFSVVAESFTHMVNAIKARGGKIWMTNLEYMTVRAKMFWEPEGKTVDADFVLCRKDGYYSDGRRPDDVVQGSLHDDLARRDFTCNAIATAEDGTYIDPFDGQMDIRGRYLRTVGDPEKRFTEDSLRMLRALRFCITKGFTMSEGIEYALCDCTLINLLDNVSEERIKDELQKMLKHNTLHTLAVLQDFQGIASKIFSRRIWLEPTMKAR